MNNDIKYVDQSFRIVSPSTQEEGIMVVKGIENVVRSCYNMEQAKESLDERLIRKIMKSGNVRYLEHGTISVKMTTSRLVSGEITELGIGSCTITSPKIKINGRVEVVRGSGWNGAHCEHYDASYRYAADSYRRLICDGVKAESAKEVLPLATSITTDITATVREWMRIIYVETSATAHPDAKAIMEGILGELRTLIPIVFEEIYRPSWR